MPFDEIVRSRARQDILSARSWEELEARGAEKALRIEARGRGLVVTDGKELIEASSLAVKLTRHKLRTTVWSDEWRTGRTPRAGVDARVCAND